MGTKHDFKVGDEVKAIQDNWIYSSGGFGPKVYEKAEKAIGDIAEDGGLFFVGPTGLLDDIYGPYHPEFYRPIPDKLTQAINPEHYNQFTIEPIEFIEKNNLGFSAGNVIKYVCRAGKKSSYDKTPKDHGVEDLEKAKKYIDMMIKALKTGSPL